MAEIVIISLQVPESQYFWSVVLGGTPLHPHLLYTMNQGRIPLTTVGRWFGVLIFWCVVDRRMYQSIFSGKEPHKRPHYISNHLTLLVPLRVHHIFIPGTGALLITHPVFYHKYNTFNGISPWPICDLYWGGDVAIYGSYRLITLFFS